MPDGYFVARLGHTHDPTELIPGKPEAILQTAETMTRFGGALDTAGTGLQAIDDGGWTGNAADSFHEAFDTEPARWKKSGDAFLDAADALTTYALVLMWAQGQAKEAIALWDQAQAATVTARADYDAKVDQFVEANPHILGPTLPFHDPGHELRVKAQGILDRAKQQLDEAGDDAERIVGKARDKAPPKPKWWQHVGNFLAEVGKGAWESLLGTLKYIWEISPIRLIVDPVGYVEDTQTRIQAAKYAVQHPAEFAKAITDWGTWKDNPGRAIGHIIGDLIGNKGLGRATKIGKGPELPDRAADGGKVDRAPDMPGSSNLGDLFKDGGKPKASELETYALEQGWSKQQSPTGPPKYVDDNGTVRMTIKEGSERTPGSENPHVELRNADGVRIDPDGNPVSRRSPGNHTPIEWDW